MKTDKKLTRSQLKQIKSIKSGLYKIVNELDIRDNGTSPWYNQIIGVFDNAIGNIEHIIYIEKMRRKSESPKRN